MINLAVINLKSILRKFFKIMIIICAFCITIKLIKVTYFSLKNCDFENISLETNIAMIKNNITVFHLFEDKDITNDSFKKILVAELAVFAGPEEEIMEEENQEEVLEFENIPNEVIEENKEVTENTQEVQAVVENVEPQNVQTSVIEANNKKDVFTDIYKTVQIKNESKYSLTEAMVTPDVNFSDNKDIIIYHTHTCESYTPTEQNQYASTGNYRTTDKNYSVVRVGTELANCLAGKGYTAIHDETYHDYPAYTGSYNRSLSTIKNLLNTYNTVDCIFDIHRDALRK